MVAVDGTGPAQVAGRRLPRLLHGALVAIGLSGLIWLLGLLIGSGTAAAETTPQQPDSQTHSTGLLGGLVGGLTSTLGGVLDTATSTVGQLTGAVQNPVVVPPASAPPIVREAPLPQPEPVQVARHAATRPAPHASAPETKPSPVIAAPVGHATPAKAVHPARKIASRPVVKQAAQPTGHERANPSGPPPSPGKPPAPAMPTGSLTAGHDGPGQARNSHGVLAGQSALEPPAEAFATHGHPADVADAAAGLPATAPD